MHKDKISEFRIFSKFIHVRGLCFKILQIIIFETPEEIEKDANIELKVHVYYCGLNLKFIFVLIFRL